MQKLTVKSWLIAVCAILILSVFTRTQEIIREAESYNLQGIEQFKAGKHEAAIELFNRAIALQPTFAKAFYNLGTVYYALKEFEKAAPAFQRAIEILPSYTGAYNQLGMTYVKTSQYEKALVVLKEAIRQNPNNAIFYYNLGYLYMQWGKFKAAAAELEKSRRLQPDKPETLINLSYAYIQQKRYREAVGIVREIVKRDQSDVPAQFLLGQLYMFTKDKQSAVAQYHLVKSLNPQMGQELYEIIYQDKLIIIRKF